MDLIEMDAASNRGVDDIRDLRENVGFAPATARFKVYIIDEAHMLTDVAFNALLKTLEEPPPHVLFVLATTEPHKILATIASRCQRFDFRRIPLEAIVDRLEYICGQEGITCPREGQELIARTATGSMRDAINLLEQAMDYHGRDLSLESVRSGLGLVSDERSVELTAATLKGDLGRGLTLISSVRDDGLDLRQFQREVVAYLRELLLVHSGAETTLGVTKEQVKEMKKLLQGIPKEDLVRALRAFGQVDLRADPLSSLPLELALAECVLARGREQSRQTAPVASGPPPRPAPSPEIPRAPSPSPPAVESAEPQSPAPVANSTSSTRSSKKKATATAATEAASDDTSMPDAEPPSISSDDAPTAPASPELERVRARWDDIYRLTKQKGAGPQGNQVPGALLNSGCTIVAVEDNVVVFAFQHEFLVEKMNADNGTHLQVLREAVQEVLGDEYNVRCIHDADAVRAHRAASRGRSGGGGGGHLVQAAREMGARLITEKE